MPFSIGRVAVGALVIVMLAVVLAACSQQAEPQTTATTADTPAPTAAPPAAAPTSAPAPTAPAATAAPRASAPQPTATSAPEPTPGPTTEPPVEPAEVSQDIARYATTFILGDGTIARYKVEEELARQGFFVATGETAEVVGRITFDDDGGVISDESGIVLQAATFRTDSDRRDRFVRERTLQTTEFPAISFRPTSVEGMPWPLDEASGEAEFTITGELTIRDQTREVTWDVMAEFGDEIKGIAALETSFEEFAMEKPSVAIVISVDDIIRLEIDFVGTLEEAGAIKVDGADDEAYAQFLGDENAPVTVIEFSDFQ